MNPTKQNSLPSDWAMLRAGLLTAMTIAVATPAFAQQAKNQTNPATPAAAGESNEAGDTVMLSPFTVDASKDKGYFAANTLAGSRMKTNIADLGSSISVVTKQQMVDTASLDINDVFRYESNTEGSYSYTPSGAGYGTLRNDGIVDANGGATVGNSTTPFTNASANRVRGIGVPTSAINYYPSIGAIPFDAYNVQSIEISRGPNSMLFGLGSPAGIVNQTTAQATLNKNNVNVTLRTDNYGSFRGSLSFNKSLIDDRLAIYGAFLYNDQQFARKPSYDLTRRQYGALTFKPFSKTTIRGNVENYKNDNRRPNSLTPRDYVTQWNLAGQPGYDPVTKTVKVGGKTFGPYIENALSPYAAQEIAWLKSQPGYNAALYDAAKGTYNGISLYSQTNISTRPGTDVAGNPVSSNPFYVPGIGFVSTGNQSRPIMQIADGQLVNWFQGLYGRKYLPSYGTAANPSLNPAQIPADAAIWSNPVWADYYNRDYSQSTGWSAINNGVATGSYKYPGVTDKSIYDWTKTNINQMNFGHDKNQNYNVEIEQEILPNLFFTAGWFRQDFSSLAQYTVAQLNVATLFVDTNINNLDGTPNPFFGKTYVEDFDPDRYINTEKDDHLRAMLAWTPDFTQHKGWTKWLGHHQFLGLWSQDKNNSLSIRQRLNIVSADSDGGRLRYLPNPNNDNNGNPTGYNFQAPGQHHLYYLEGPNDPNGTVTRGSGTWDYASYNGPIRVYDYATSQFTTVGVNTLYNTFDSPSHNQRQVDSLSFGWTSYLWQDRLIGTFGVRKDKYKARANTTGTIKDEDGNLVAATLTNPQKWTNGYLNTDLINDRFNRWDRLEGTTRTLGGVLRPFRNWGPIDSRADTGNILWEFVRDFGLSYNKSNNFNPPASAQVDPFGNPLAKPTGEGKDYGFQFSILRNKLFARITWFDASNQNERAPAGTAISRLTDNIDQTLFRNWARTIVKINMGMDPRLSTFNDALPQAVENQVQAEAAKIWQQDYNYYVNIGSIGTTRDAKAKGVEAELNFNPTSNWTMKLTFGKQSTYYNNVLVQYDQLFGARSPIWKSAKASDWLKPEYANFTKYIFNGTREVDLTTFWAGYGFDTNVRLDEPNGYTTVEKYFNGVVLPQAQLSRDLNGQEAPGQRKYRWSFLTSYNFDKGMLKGFFVGGNERWESKSIIGYYGRSSGASGTQLDVSDITKPIYDDANFYTDLWVGYGRKILKSKVGMKIQLNCANVFESGGLQTVAVNYDGSPYAFRIIDPRQFILTTSFDF